MTYPIYATGTNPGGPYKEGPGEINVPISCGGISINPGDIIVMDEDGVIVIPWQEGETVPEAAKASKLRTKPNWWLPKPATQERMG